MKDYFQMLDSDDDSESYVYSRAECEKSYKEFTERKALGPSKDFYYPRIKPVLSFLRRFKRDVYKLNKEEKINGEIKKILDCSSNFCDIAIYNIETDFPYLKRDSEK